MNEIPDTENMEKRLRILITIGLSIYAFFFILQSFILIRYPYPVAYGEGIILNQARLLAQAKPIYQDINSYPYVVGNYPLIFPFFYSFFIKFFGVTLAWGRIITFFATLLSAFLVFSVVKSEARGINNSTYWAGGLFLASPFIYNYYPMVRVDALAFLFSLLGLYFVYRYENCWKLYLAVIFFILALYTKQLFVAAPIATLIYLCIKNFKKAVLFFVLLVGIYVVLFFIINRLTDGQFFLHNYLYNMNRFSLHQLVKMYVKTLQSHSILFGLAVFWIAYKKRWKSLFTYYFIVAGLVALSAGKLGSNYNYFCEFVGAGIIIIGEFLNGMEQEKALVYSLLLMQLVIFIHAPFMTGYTRKTLTEEQIQRISQFVKNTPGPIISEDAGLLVLNGKEVLYQPFICTQLAHQGIWDQGRFLEDITNKKFSAIILTFKLDDFDRARLTDEMAEVMKNNYILKQKIGMYYIYVPYPGSE